MIHVAVCLDGSALSERTLPHALAVARAFDGRLSLLHVLEVPTTTSGCSPDPLEWQLARLQARAYLESLVERTKRPAGNAPGDEAIEIDGEVLEGDPTMQVARWAADHSVDLVVFGSHGSKGVTRWPLASTARKLLEALPCSILLVPAAALEGAAPRSRFERILVPLDGSPWSESALPWAVQIAGRHGADLVLAHAVPCPELTRAGAVPPTAEDLDLERRLIARNERVARDYLDHLRGRYSAAGLSVSTLVESSGRVVLELEHAIARAEPDLVVLPACGDSGPDNELQGSVVPHLLGQASRPVLLVRTPAAAAGVRSRETRASASRAPSLARP